MATIDLASISSLPIKLEEPSLNLVLGKGVTSSKPASRTLAEMRDTLLDPGAKGAGELYFMYRDLCLSKDKEMFKSLNLRFDVTIMRSGFTGREFIKTAGHYHPMIPGLGISYPEIYEVIHGGALYLLQKIRTLADPRRTVDVVAIEARPGDRVVIPPNYGHVTINPYKTTLVMTDVTADGFQSVYGPYKSLRGAAYHLVLEEGKPGWVSNSKYINPPKIRQMEAKEFPGLGLTRGKALYEVLVKNPESFELLNKPLRHMDFLNSVLR